jgi:cell division transport system permease protein
MQKSQKNGSLTNFFYIWRIIIIMAEAKSTISKNKKGGVNYVSSILGVATVLLLLGVLGWVVINTSQLSRSFKEAVQVEVQFNDNTRDEMGMALMEVLKQHEFTKSAEYITKEQAAKDYQLMNNENFSEVIDINPLYSSIILHLNEKYINKDSLLLIKELIMKSNIVRDVDYKPTLVDIMNNKVKTIGAAILGISILLILLVIFMIDNTIRLAMYSNRFLIKTMQMVGATRWFISKPFALRAILNGFISAVLAILGVMLTKKLLDKVIPELQGLHNTQAMIILYLIIILLGVAISTISTHRSVIKYLKTSLDDLY